MSLYNFGSRLSQSNTNTSARRLNELPETATNQQVLSQSSNTSEKASEAIAELRTRLEEITKIFNDVVSNLSRLKDIGINSEVVNRIINSATELLKQRIETITDRIEERLNDLAQENNGAGASGNSNQNSGGATQDSSDDASDSNKPSPIQDIAPEPITSPITQPPVSQPPVDATPVAPVAPVATVTPPPANSSSSSSNSIDMGLLGNLLNNQNQGQSQGQNNNSGNTSNNTGSTNSQAGSNQNSNGSANSQNGNSGNTSSNSSSNTSSNSNANPFSNVPVNYFSNDNDNRDGTDGTKYSHFGQKVSNANHILEALDVDSYFKVVAFANRKGIPWEEGMDQNNNNNFEDDHTTFSMYKNDVITLRVGKINGLNPATARVELKSIVANGTEEIMPFNYKLINMNGEILLEIDPQSVPLLSGQNNTAIFSIKSGNISHDVAVKMAGDNAPCSVFTGHNIHTIDANEGDFYFNLAKDDITSFEWREGYSVIVKPQMVLKNAAGTKIADINLSAPYISADDFGISINTNHPAFKALMGSNQKVTLEGNYAPAGSASQLSHDFRTTFKLNIIKDFDSMYKVVDEGSSSEAQIVNLNQAQNQSATMSVDILNFDDEVSASNDNSNKQQEIANIFEDNNQHSNSQNDDMNYNSSQEYNCCDEVTSNSPQTYELFNFGEYYS